MKKFQRMCHLSSREAERMNELLVRIRFLLPLLPRAEHNVAQSLLDRPELIRDLTLAQLADEIHSNDATIVRFCKRLGYRGYTETKTA